MPARWISKVFWGAAGFTFFCLWPLQSHYPRYRRPLSPVWWALWGAPTDAQFAVQLLRRRLLEGQLNGSASSNPEDTLRSKHDDEASSSPALRAPNKRYAAASAVASGAIRLLSDLLLSSSDPTRVQAGEAAEKARKLGAFLCQHNSETIRI